MSKMLVNFIQKVNNNEIREEELDGHKYIVLPSKTMPAGVVMNRLMYPGDQIDKTIQSIDNSPAPIDHPKINGKYVDARDTRAALEFGAGVNKLIGKEGDKYSVEKWVNKELLQNTERGKRLQKAIDTGAPIHTSTGVFLKPVPNSAGKNEYGEYDAEVEIFEFNHDAILPDSVGANTPEKGTGIFVNAQSEDEEIEVMFINLSDDEQIEVSDELINDESKGGVFDRLVAKIANALRNNVKSDVDNKPEIDPMKEKMIAALNAAGIATEGLSDDQLFDKHSQLIAANAAKEVEQPKPLTAEDVANIFDERIKVNEATKAEAAKTALVEKVIAANSNQYTETDKDMLMGTPEKVLNSFLPKPKAAGIGAAFNHQTDESDHDLNLNEMMEAK